MSGRRTARVSVTTEQLQERVEALLDKLDALDPEWRSRLPDCKHAYCYPDYPAADTVDALHTAMWLLGDDVGVWQFKDALLEDQ